MLAYTYPLADLFGTMLGLFVFFIWFWLLIVIFGAAFEFPAVLVGLELAGVVKSASLKRVRRFAFLGIVIFSAVVTPSSDPFSMMALVVPLAVFYEGAIIIGSVTR